MPEESTSEEIRDAYIEGWKLGLKAVAIYRDGCKRSQPLSTSKDTGDDLEAEVAARAAAGITRRRLPDERQAITHKFSINGHEGFLTVGLYEDGQPGEVFLLMAKEGSTISGLMDSFAQAVSVALQYGVPLQILVDKFTHSRFEPSGFTKNPEIPMAKSVMDYVFRWLASKFLSREAQEVAGVIQRPEPAARAGSRTSRCAARHPAISAPRTTSCGPATTPMERPPGPGDLSPAAGRAVVSRLRLDHGAERQLLQVHELRLHQRLQLTESGHAQRRCSSLGVSNFDCFAIRAAMCSLVAPCWAGA